MKTYSSTTLKYFTNNCPKALGNHEDDVPRDTGIFQAGIAAHAVLQVVGEKGATDVDDQRAVSNAVVAELMTKGREFNGRPEPPMHPESAMAGREIALNYLEGTALPADALYETGLGMDAEGNICGYMSSSCRYRAITDVIYPDVDGDIEDYQADVMCVRDYKSAWPTSADELETLQRKGQAVLTWLQYRDQNSVQGIKLEVVNLRTCQSFSKVIWLDEEGEKLLSQWRDDILLLCNAADVTREPRPGGGCLGCAWVLSCQESYKTALGDNVDALGLITLEARRTELLKVLKAEITEESVEVAGGFVGYKAMSKSTLKEDAIYQVLSDFYNRAGRTVTVGSVQDELPLEIGLLEAAKLGSGNINAIAKHLYDKTEMDARTDLLNRCLEDTGATQFKCWKK